jgi:hypothetical protein
MSAHYQIILYESKKSKGSTKRLFELPLTNDYLTCFNSSLTVTS